MLYERDMCNHQPLNDSDGVWHSFDPADTHLQDQQVGQLDRQLRQQAHSVNGSQQAQHQGRFSKLILRPLLAALSACVWRLEEQLQLHSPDKDCISRAMETLAESGSPVICQSGGGT